MRLISIFPKLLRMEFKEVIEENPSLKPQIASIVEKAYNHALIDAFKETGIDLDIFPAQCPWSFEQISDDSFYPE